MSITVAFENYRSSRLTPVNVTFHSVYRLEFKVLFLHTVLRQLAYLNIKALEEALNEIYALSLVLCLLTDWVGNTMALQDLVQIGTFAST